MTLKHKIIQAIWIAILLAVVVLFFVAMQKKQTGFCTSIEIEITNQQQQSFVNKKSIEEIIRAAYNLQSTSIKKIDIQAIEKAIEKNEWVQNADLFFDAQHKLKVLLQQRNPIARLFSLDGATFFLDSAGKRLPVTNTTLARVLVITGFPSSNLVLSSTDSALLMQVKKISNAIAKDSILQSQIAQLNITITGSFELSTAMGNQKIFFGDDGDIDEKFNKVKTFYTKIFTQFGVEKYSAIDVRFKNQIVATQSNYVAQNLSLDSLNSNKDSLVSTTNLQSDTIQRQR
ncbi:MAG: cell division protein FtsQ/DivIB [Chitinophagaceae bacterium]